MTPERDLFYGLLKNAQVALSYHQEKIHIHRDLLKESTWCSFPGLIRDARKIEFPES